MAGLNRSLTRLPDDTRRLVLSFLTDREIYQGLLRSANRRVYYDVTQCSLILSRESFAFLMDVTDRMKLWDTTYRVGLQRNVTATNFLVARYLGQHHMSHFLTMLLGTSIGLSLVVFATLHFLK